MVVFFLLCLIHSSCIFQNNVLHLLEIALVDGMSMVVDTSQPTTSNLVDLRPIVDEHCSNYVEDYKKVHLEGIILIPNNDPTVVLSWFSANLTICSFFFLSLIYRF